MNSVIIIGSGEARPERGSAFLTGPVADRGPIIRTGIIPMRFPIFSDVGSSRRRRVWALAFLLASSPAFAEPSASASGNGTGELAFSGFGTLGIVRSNSDQTHFLRDLSQPRGATRKFTARVDSLLGLQANYRAGEQVELVAQAISRYGWDANYRPELTWAFAKFDPTPASSLRLGRLGTEFFMLADSRHVGYSYLPIRPPGDYYGTLPFNFVDGIDATATWPLAGGLLRGKLFTGFDQESLPIAGEEWRLHGSRMSGGYLDYQTGGWQWRLGAAQMRFKRDFPLLKPLRDNLYAAAAFTPQAAEAADRIAVENKLATLYSAGAVYDDGPLHVQLMLSRTRQQSATYENTRAGYLIGAYRLGEATPFAGVSWSKSRRNALATGLPDVPPFAALNAALAAFLAVSHSDQETWIIGTRWDFRRNLALKAQLDMIRGRPDSLFLFGPTRADFNGRLNVLSVALDFVF